MEHIVFGYKLILLLLGIVTLFISFLTRRRDSYIKLFLNFYLIYFLIIVMDLVRSYLIISSFWESTLTIFISYAITLFLNFSLTLSGYKISKPKMDKTKWIIPLLLLISYLIVISPLSVEFDEIAKTATVKPIYYLSLLSIITVGGVTTFNLFKQFIKVENSKEKLFFSGLTLFIAFITTEFILSLMFSLFNPVTVIGVADRNVQLSTIPFLFLSISAINLFLSLIISNESKKNLEDFKKSGFSQREAEILLLVVKGFSYKKIGEELCISLSTVKTHMNNIFKKSQVNSRFELLKKIE